MYHLVYDTATKKAVRYGAVRSRVRRIVEVITFQPYVTAWYLARQSNPRKKIYHRCKINSVNELTQKN